jgi:hypothetical protein
MTARKTGRFVRPNRGRTVLGYGLLVVAASACRSEEQGHRRETPVCAIQDCATGRIVDDGCVGGGLGSRRCLACVNACEADTAPRSAR